MLKGCYLYSPRHSVVGLILRQACDIRTGQPILLPNERHLIGQYNSKPAPNVLTGMFQLLCKCIEGHFNGAYGLIITKRQIRDAKKRGDGPALCSRQPEHRWTPRGRIDFRYVRVARKRI
jgi:hypothetical protein